MFDKLSSYWKYGSTFSAIEIVSNNDVNRFYQTKVKKKNGEFTDFQYTEADSFNELSQTQKTRQHCILIINTEQVLIKETTKATNINNALSIAFPGLSANDFYYQITESSGNQYVAVIKKEEVDLIISTAKEAKFDVVDFSIGFGSISKILPLIEEQSIQTATYCLRKDKNNIQSFERSETISKEYQIADVIVGSKWLLSVSGLFSYEQMQPLEDNISEKAAILNTNYLESNFFKKALFIGVAIFFVGMLLNLLWFSGYNSEVQKLQSESEFSSLQIEQTASRLQDLEGKEKLVSSIINSGNSRSSFYVNTVVSNLPESILMSEFQYQPLKKSIRPDKVIEYENDIIVISGESNNKSVFSNWLTILEDELWIKTVTVIAYGTASTKTDEFTLHIKIKDETKD